MLKKSFFILLVVVLCGFGQAFAADAPPVLPVDKLIVNYARPTVAGLPPLADIQNLSIKLGSELGKDGKLVYVEYVPGKTAALFTIGSLAKGGGLKHFRASAIHEISARITKYINDQGFVVVQVQADKTEVDPVDSRDLRSGATDLHLVIYMGVVSEVRAVASGGRIPPDQPRINNPLHQATTQASPVSPKPGQSLVRKDLLDQYVFYLNRHPGRRVDIAVSQANPNTDPTRPDYKFQEGDIVLDYLISESRPWSVVVQASNTGTAQTSAWRERFGFTNNQLTNHDDILSVNYTTASFGSTSEDVDLSYDAPFLKLHNLRWKVYGSYEEFTASDLGTGSENFIGEQENGAGELTTNLWQQRDQFIDLYAGAQYSHIRTNLNPVAGANLTGSADIAEPYVGIRAQRDSEVATTVGSLTFRYGMPFDRMPSYTDGKAVYEGPAGLNQLGRTDVNGDFPLLQADITESFFIEPLLNPDAFEPGKTTPSTRGTQQSTLANEVVLSARGQYSFGKRLIPQEQEAVGGLYSVRGYPESFVAGDSVLIGSAEYRLHVPRLFAIQPNPDSTPVLGHPFRWSPQQSYGRPDWDLIGRAFLDAGCTHSYRNDLTISNEPAEFLLGTGLGVEFQFSPDTLPTVDVRADWGVALHRADSGNQETSVGSQRFSFVFTLLY